MDERKKEGSETPPTTRRNVHLKWRVAAPLSPEPSTKRSLPRQTKKEGRLVYRVRRGVDGYKDDRPSDSEMDEPQRRPDSPLSPEQHSRPSSSEGGEEVIPCHPVRPCSLLEGGGGEDWSIHHVRQVAALLDQRQKFFHGELEEGSAPALPPLSKSLSRKSLIPTVEKASAEGPAFTKENKSRKKRGPKGVVAHEKSLASLLIKPPMPMHFSKCDGNFSSKGKGAVHFDPVPILNINSDHHKSKKWLKETQLAIEEANETLRESNRKHAIALRNSKHVQLEQRGRSRGRFFEGEVKPLLRRRREASGDERVKALGQLAAKPLPPSRMDLSKGDEILCRSLTFLKMDPRKILGVELEQKPQGVRVPSITAMRNSFKRHLHSKKQPTSSLSF